MTITIAIHVSAFVCAVATNTLAAQVAARPLRISERPSLTIGREGDTKYEFVRVARAVELPGRQLVVADARSAELRVYGADGKFVRSLGRSGAGPGEFTSISSINAYGDTLFVWDRNLRRLTRYLGNGTLLGTAQVNVSGSERPFDLIAKLANGNWLVTTLAQPMIARRGGTYRDSVRVGMLSFSGSTSVSWLATYPGALFWVYNPTNASHGIAVGVAPLAPWTRAAVVSNQIVVADGSVASLDVLTEGGHRVRQIQVPLTPKRVSLSHIARLRDEELAKAHSASGREMTLAKYEAGVVPQRAPVSSEMVVGADSELWTQEYALEEEEPTRCAVVRVTGEVVGLVVLPVRARLLFVGRDFLWLAVSDEDSVERLERYSLFR